jgi:hypothetical protein
VLTDGEPATIECYRDGYLPKLCMYPGSYDHITGVISRDSEEADIYLQSINAPVTSPTVTTAILSTLTPTVDLRGGKYICDIQESDILPTPLTETVFYDEYASHKDTAKIANGIEYDNYAAMEVAIVAPNNVPHTSVVSLKKVKGAEKNDIKTDNLTGDSRVIYSPLFDYSYWSTRFNLCGYLAVNTSGRPAVAFDGTEVRQLPILANVFLDTEDMKRQMDNARNIAGTEVSLRFKTIEELADRLIATTRLSDEAYQDMTEKAFKVVTELYTRERNGEEIIKFYHSILNN